MGALIGVILHAIGGFAAGSFYIPFKMVKKWKWESAWFVLGIAAWLLSPIIFASCTVSDLGNVLMSADSETNMWTFVFGMLWGIGGLTFGLSMRYLGVSLGMTVALGFCTAFGTIIPPLYKGELMGLLNTPEGKLTILGIILCLVAIAIVGYAGMRKEKEEKLAGKKNEAVEEFDFKKGILVATISGILSACFAFGLEAGAPIADAALKSGTKDLFKNNAILIWILWGGITINGLYSLFLNFKNKSFSDYTDSDAPLTKNYLWAILGGVTWYLQFFFYGMGTTFLGKDFEFASWSIHMAFIILFSNVWGILFNEWKGASSKTKTVLGLGLFVILLSIILIGLANTLAGYF
ncbi:MAG: L-rhamnose/proton symporter RhaT [Saprospiraceae bacterium]